MELKKIKTILAFSFIALLLVTTNTSFATNYSAGFALGYNKGFGLQASGTFSNFAQDFPLKLRFSIGYTMTNNPGSSPGVRRIFINDATNGTPEKEGWFWDYKFDLMYRVNWLSMNRLYLFAGPRYESFTGNFKYIGGNEEFDVLTSQWGVGTGLQSFFSISSTLDMTLSAGVDYYFHSRLKGHDTEYYPDNENVNPRDEYTYDDADQAVNQPEFLLNLMIGLNYKF